MIASQPDKWTAFLLSLAVPGAGQLWAGSGWCVPWLAAAALLNTVPLWLDPAEGGIAAGLRFALLVVLGLFSAEHAKRCLEPMRRDSPTGQPTVRVSCGPMHGRAVALRIELDIPRKPADVWAVVADLPRFGCIDPFHSRVIVLAPVLRPGVSLALEHRAFGATWFRFGRLLKWRTGQDYAFSDLSARGPHHGFPHVFFVRVEPAEAGRPDQSRLSIVVRGKWTARWLPLWLGQFWLRYVCAEHARLLRAAF